MSDIVERLRAFGDVPDPEPAGELSTLEIKMLIACLDAADEIERLRVLDGLMRRMIAGQHIVDIGDDGWWVLDACQQLTDVERSAVADARRTAGISPFGFDKL